MNFITASRPAGLPLGTIYAPGIAIAWWLAARRSKLSWSPVDREQVDDLVFYCALGVVLGGRVGYTLFYGGDRLLENPAWALLGLSNDDIDPILELVSTEAKQAQGLFG